MRREVFIVSSFTVDRIKGLGTEGVGIGGPPYYCALALLHMGVEEVAVVGPAGEVHRAFSRRAGVRVLATSSDVPTFELKYLNGTGERTVRLVSRGGGAIPIDGVSELMKGALVIVNPVFREVAAHDVRLIRRVAKTLAIDVQGFVRGVVDGGYVKTGWSDEAFEVLEVADVAHADLSEAPRNGGIVGAARKLSRVSNGVVMVSNGEHGLIAVIEGRMYYVPALPGIVGESTGTGDILLAVTSLAIHEGEYPLKAIAMGAVAAGLKVSRVTPPWFSKYEVEVLAQKLLKDVKPVD